MSWPFRTGIEHGISLPRFLTNGGGVVSEGATTDNPKSGSYAFRVVFSNADTWQPNADMQYTRANTTSSRLSLIASIMFSDVSELASGGGFKMGVASDHATTDSFVFVQINPDGSVEFRRVGTQLSSSGTVLSSLPAGTIISNSWYTIELMTFIHATTGTVDVAINGALVYSATGLDTLDGIGTINTTSGWQMRCASDSAGGTSLTIDIDDVMFGVDETQLFTINTGIPVHEALVPTSDIETDGTPSTGTNHWELVDEIPPVSTDYVEFDTNGDRERFGFSDRTETGDVIGVGLWATASDPSTTDTIRTLINSNGTEVETSDLVLSATAGTPYYFSRETDPDTAAAWSSAGVNAVTAGARRTA